MPKPFNRAIQIYGELGTVGTPIVKKLILTEDNTVLFASGATVPTNADAGYAVGCIFIDTDGGTGTTLYQNEGSATSADFNAIASAAAGGVNSWDELYDNDKALAIDAGVLTFTVTTAANGLYVNKTNAGAGVPLVIGNSGTGNDIENATTSWYIKRSAATGVLELGSTGSINVTDGALSIGKTATATTLLGTLTVAEGISVSDGANTFTDNSNIAASFSIVNATATTYAGVVKVTAAEMLGGTGILATFAKMTSGKALSIVASAATTGTLVYLQALEGTLTGKYIQCYDGTADDFSVGAAGATIIAGASATNVLTVTAGDVVVSDGSLTLTDADDANSVTVVNNTITTADLADISSTSISTGALVKLNANTAAHDGEILELISAGDATATPTGLSVTIASVTTGAAKGINVVMAGATTTAVGITVNMAALTTGTGQLITTAGVMTTTGSLLTLTANAATTAAGLLRINATGLTSGTAIKVAATEATLTTGKYLEFYDGAANDFSVAKYGATVIAGNAIGTAALTLTAGDLVVTSGYLKASAGGIQCAAVARTATVDGLTTGTVADGTTYVTVTAGGDANSIIILPTPTPGNVVWLYVGATGYELRSDTPASVAINGGTGAGAESAIAASTLVRMVCTSSTTWVGTQFAAAGTESAVQVAAA